MNPSSEAGSVDQSQIRFDELGRTPTKHNKERVDPAHSEIPAVPQQKNRRGKPSHRELLENEFLIEP